MQPFTFGYRFELWFKGTNMRNKLTQRQESFCLNYFKCGNASEAGILAKYSPKSVRNITSILLTNPNIKARLKELQQAAEDAAVMTVVERKRKLSVIGRAELTDFIVDDEPVLSKNTPNSAAAEEYSVSTRYTRSGDPIITRSVKLLNPVSAIQELNKMEKIYDDSTRVNVNLNQVVLKVVYEDGIKTGISDNAQEAPCQAVVVYSEQGKAESHTGG